MQHVHFIGIGGTGLSAIAKVLLESGYSVSGSDQEYSPLAKAVDAAGAQVFIGHQASNVNGSDIVIRSSAVPDDNPEVQAALEKSIPVLKRADYLGSLMEGRQGIAVAGSHGKTTTTAMLAWVLTALDQDPTFIVGGVVSNLDTNARAGKGDAFVIEADEYDYMFLGLKPKIAVITNVEHDHPDIFHTPEVFRRAFLDFVRVLPPDGILLACGDDPGASDIMTNASKSGYQVISYGIESSHYDYFADNIVINHFGGFDFDMLHDDSLVTSVSLQVPGDHNVKNALASLAVIDQMDLPVIDAARALEEFIGAGRRFQVIGDIDGVTLIDDYAHHPTEIKATLAAAKARYPHRKIWAVWQPHTYSRTKTLFSEFVSSFDDADSVLVTEIYRSREPFDPEFSSIQVVQAMDHLNAYFSGSLADTTKNLLDNLRTGDVVLVLSAGDATQICQDLMQLLSKQTKSKNR
ncbi:MAG: UDP-N-acetylmuramate--L-alanine ligase [Anaerolineales bacterium]|nr:UDP-N-acetylmuramate--L-alanine ligase [Chloroflexota bacterium]MBL6980559.1 UDP-N-acetylmuramate--L-alanine ligase [Anaerolineales bacterium]